MGFLVFQICFVDYVEALRHQSLNISDVLNRELQAINEKVKYMNVVIEKTVKKPVLL